MRLVSAGTLEMTRKGIAEFYVRPLEQVVLTPAPEANEWIVSLRDAVELTVKPRVRKGQKHGGTRARPFVFGTEGA